MIINIDHDNLYTPYIDNVYAYWQHCDENYRSGHEIHINRPDLPHDRNILITQNQGQLAPEQCSEYDVVLYDNRNESFGVATIGLDQYIDIDKVFMLTSSKLHHRHPLKEKNIWYPYYIFVKQGHAGNYFDGNWPHYYDLIDLRNEASSKTQGMIFVNGQNRSWRNFLIEIIRDAVPDLSIHNSSGKHVVATNDCGFESQADSDFRNMINDQYRQCFSDDKDYTAPGDVIDTIGIDGKFGASCRNLQLIQAYRQFRCIIYPETSWLNNDMQITEKTVKCFVTRGVPWPIGGMHLHAQMLEVGFHTAWQLLPKSFQAFDAIEDHQERHRQMTLAIKWLFDNQSVLCSSEADDLTNKNFYNWHCWSGANCAMARLSDILIGV